MKIRVNEHQLERVLIKLQDQRITNRINETKEEAQKNAAIKWLNKRYGKDKLKVVQRPTLGQKTTKTYKPGQSIFNSEFKERLEMSFYVNSNNEIIIVYISEDYPTLINLEAIWEKMESFFHLSWGDIESILDAWVTETYPDLKNVETSACPSEMLETLWN